MVFRVFVVLGFGGLYFLMVSESRLGEQIISQLWIRSSWKTAPEADFETFRSKVQLVL